MADEGHQQSLQLGEQNNSTLDQFIRHSALPRTRRLRVLELTGRHPTVERKPRATARRTRRARRTTTTSRHSLRKPRTASIGLEGISPRTFKVKTTVVDPTASFPPDLVNRHFDRDRLDAVWLTDITYLTCGEGEMFLCAVRDGHSRKVLGYSISDHIGAELVTDVIDAAVAARGGRCRGTILHSDRGGEYTAHLTAKACFRHGLRRSMGATGICWDNSPAESFWSTFKHEHYYRHAYATKTELVAAVDKWIRFYNSVRRHSAIGMLSPDNFEQSLRAAA